MRTTLLLLAFLLSSPVWAEAELGEESGPTSEAEENAEPPAAAVPTPTEETPDEGAEPDFAPQTTEEGPTAVLESPPAAEPEPQPPAETRYLSFTLAPLYVVQTRGNSFSLAGGWSPRQALNEWLEVRLWLGGTALKSQSAGQLFGVAWYQAGATVWPSPHVGVGFLAGAETWFLNGGTHFCFTLDFQFPLAFATFSGTLSRLIVGASRFYLPGRDTYEFKAGWVLAL